MTPTLTPAVHALSLDRRQWAKETLERLREAYHSPLDDRLTVRRTLREMTEEVAHER